MLQANSLIDAVGAGNERPIRQVAIVVNGENPSFDYYFAPRLGLFPSPPLRRFNLFASPRELAEVSWADTFVIFCRYVSDVWLTLIRNNQHALAGVGLFVDDDIEAMASSRDMTMVYRLKLHLWALRPWRGLRPVLNRVWVSTPHLANRWRELSPQVLPPVADVVDLSSSPLPSAEPLVGLHAGGSHRADKAWLEPVVRGVLAASSDVIFEVVAEDGGDWRWRGDPRVRVVPFRSWPEYRADTAGQGRDLLLAPFLPTAVNAARAGVKRIDAARCGAALLVADHSVYQVSAAEAALGMAVPLDAGSWINAVLSLVGDPERKRALVRLNRENLLAVRRAITPLFEPAPDAASGAWRAI